MPSSTLFLSISVGYQIRCWALLVLTNQINRVFALGRVRICRIAMFSASFQVEQIHLILTRISCLF
jgi:hypothetical protein